MLPLHFEVHYLLLSETATGREFPFSKEILLEIIIDLPIRFPINNIIYLLMYAVEDGKVKLPKT